MAAHTGGVYSIIDDFDGNIFSGSSDRFATKWDLNNFSNLSFAAQLPAQIYSLAFIKNQNILFAGTFKGFIHILNLNANQESKILSNHQSSIFSLQYAENKNLVIASSADGCISFIDSIEC